MPHPPSVDHPKGPKAYALSATATASGIVNTPDAVSRHIKDKRLKADGAQGSAELLPEADEAEPSSPNFSACGSLQLHLQYISLMGTARASAAPPEAEAVVIRDQAMQPKGDSTGKGVWKPA